jgi:hypothetical protein
METRPAALEMNYDCGSAVSYTTISFHEKARQGEKYLARALWYLNFSMSPPENRASQ